MSDLNDFFSDNEEDDVWSKPDLSDWSNEDATEEQKNDIDLFEDADDTDVESNDSMSDDKETDNGDFQWKDTNESSEEDSDFQWKDTNESSEEDSDFSWSESKEDENDFTWSDVKNQETTNVEASTTDANDSWTTTDPWENDSWKTTDNSKKQDNTWGNDEINTNPEPKEIKIKNFSFNYKQASLIIAGICVFLALIVFGMSKIHIVRNTTQQQNVSKEASNVESNATGSKTLKYVPNTTAINYDSNVITSSGKIAKKDRYLLGQQLIYDLVIDIPAGTDTISLHYYCSRDTYESLYENTAVTVDYQVASDNYYSIKSVKAQ